jgi:hypothetical protein
MFQPLSFIGAAKPIDDIDLPKLGNLIGVGEDEIHAIMDTEAPGSGFDAMGRPKALFEPHRFYRNVDTAAERAEAVSKNLAYAHWGAQKYPADSYNRIRLAMAINETAALKSTSWGRSQILGENYLDLGYASVQDMVTAFMADEENHIKGMVDFIRANHIDDDLRAHRWAVVARVYNGPGYAKNHYDTKLEAAYNHWRGIRDTPIPA